jgi:hypothetical protein
MAAAHGMEARRLGATSSADPVDIAILSPAAAERGHRSPVHAP